MNLLNSQDWADFKSAISDFHDTFEQKVLKWYRKSTVNNVQMEEAPSPLSNIPVELLVQVNYNYMRTWPITFTSETGQLDRQSMQVFLNKEYLRTSGFINPSGYFDYNADYDIFEMDGIKYKSFGDTAASQAMDDDLLILLILKRENQNTSD